MNRFVSKTHRKMSESIATSIETPSPSIPTSQSAFDVLTSPSIVNPTRRCDRRRIGARVWRRTGHQANIRRGTQQSRIWEHGDEYVEDAQRSSQPSWICDYCDAVVSIKENLSSSNVVRHLKKSHQIILKRTRNDREEEDEAESLLSRETSREASVASTPQAGFRSLVTAFNVETFRSLLLRWIVQRQVPFSAVEHTEFRDLLLYLQPSLERYFVRSHQSISNWVDIEYALGKESLKRQLAESLSRIHLSFDIWTSPSTIPILGVCAHFLSPSLELKHPLLGLKSIEGAHTGEQIAESVGALMEEFEIVSKWGVNVADNASNCSTACKALVKRFRPSESENSRRSRCLGHIINLAAQAFIFGEDCEAFIAEVESVEEGAIRDKQQLMREQRIWRSKGAFGKFHNLVKYIRATSQRRQEFKAIIEIILKSSKDIIL